MQKRRKQRAGWRTVQRKPLAKKQPVKRPAKVKPAPPKVKPAPPKVKPAPPKVKPAPPKAKRPSKVKPAPKSADLTKAQRSRMQRRLNWQIKNESAKERFERAFKKFKPKAAEKDSFVFIGIDGKRMSASSRKKGWPVYVGKRGGKRGGKHPFKPEWQTMPVYVPNFRSRWKVTDANQPKATDKFYAEGKQTESFLQAGKFEGTSLDWSKVAEKLGRDIVKWVKRKMGKDYRLKVRVFVKDKDGNERSYDADRVFKEWEISVLRKGFLGDFIRRNVYAWLANQWDDDDLVTVGSAKNVKRLKHNRGKPMTKWKMADGLNEWGRGHKKVVRITRLDWNLSRYIQRG